MKYNFEDTRLVEVKRIDDGITPPIMLLTFSMLDTNQELLKKIDELVRNNKFDWAYNVNLDYEGNKIEVEAKRI